MNLYKINYVKRHPLPQLYFRFESLFHAFSNPALLSQVVSASLTSPTESTTVVPILAQCFAVSLKPSLPSNGLELKTPRANALINLEPKQHHPVPSPSQKNLS